MWFKTINGLTFLAAGNLPPVTNMATFTQDWSYRGEGNSSLVIANTVVCMFSLYVPINVQSTELCWAMYP